MSLIPHTKIHKFSLSSLYIASATRLFLFQDNTASSMDGERDMRRWNFFGSDLNLYVSIVLSVRNCVTVVKCFLVYENRAVLN